MFDGVVHRFPWLTPHLQPRDVSEKMALILEGCSSEIMIPFYARFVPLLKMFAIEWNDLFHHYGGANDDLKSLKGRPNR